VATTQGPTTNRITATGDLISSTLVENDGTLTLQNQPFYTLSNPLNNTGTFNVVDSAVVIAGGLTNSGSVSVDASSLLDVSAAPLLSSNSLSGGSYNIAGLLTIGTGDGPLNAIASGTSLTLTGTNYSIQDTNESDVINGFLNANAGTLVVQGGAQLTTQNGTTFTNDGGTLTVDGPGSQVSVGTPLMSGYQHDVPTGGSTDFQNGAVMGGTAGTVNVTNGGTLAVTGAFINGQSNSIVNVLNCGSQIASAGLTNFGVLTVGAGATFDASAGNFTNVDSNGVLSGGGAYTVGGQLVVNTAITTIGTGTTVTLQNFGVIVDNDPQNGESNALGGLSTLAGTLNISTPLLGPFVPKGAYFEPASGPFTITGTGSLNLGGGSNGIGSAIVNSDVLNNGAITLAGSIPLGRKESLSTSPGDILIGSFLGIYGALTNAPALDSNSNPIPGTGVVTLSGGAELDADSLTNSGAINNGGGSLITLNTTSSNSGTIGLTGASTLQFGSLLQEQPAPSASNSHQPPLLTNSGTITSDGTGNTISVFGGDLFNTAAGVITLTASVDPSDIDQQDWLQVSGDFVNNGSLSIGAGDWVDVLGVYKVKGTDAATDVQGLLTASVVAIDSGATLTGTGFIGSASTPDFGDNAPAEVYNHGTINPGGDPMPGALTITGDYTQTQHGTLLLDFEGSDANGFLWDRLLISGNANLGGTLAVNVDSAFSATVGDIFDIVAAGTFNGDFTTFNPGTFDNGLTFVEVTDAMNGDIALEVENATPEPSTWLLLGSAIMAMGGVLYRRRRTEHDHAA
jgi:hypothetical protein